MLQYIYIYDITRILVITNNNIIEHLWTESFRPINPSGRGTLAPLPRCPPRRRHRSTERRQQGRSAEGDGPGRQRQGHGAHGCSGEASDVKMLNDAIYDSYFCLFVHIRMQFMLVFLMWILFLELDHPITWTYRDMANGYASEDLDLMRFN